MNSLTRAVGSPKISDERFVRLYKEVFPVVVKYISRRQGTLEQAKDIFQDALIMYYEQILSTEKQIEQTEKAYIFGIARHLWIHQFKLGVNYEPLSDKIELAENVNDERISDKQLMRLLMNAGERCVSLLKTFYYDKLSMTEVAERFGFRNERSATVQKFKCLEKVRDFIKEKTLGYEDFVE
ncbi:MAG TPA: sigma-70 family RNA polymerase sigma factor [Pseudosphingobacterium sp.]|nr:sigma-70 family RNA polymerase sigma factor [Pseudosphingobacterium sp.]